MTFLARNDLLNLVKLKDIQRFWFEYIITIRWLRCIKLISNYDHWETWLINNISVYWLWLSHHTHGLVCYRLTPRSTFAPSTSGLTFYPRPVLACMAETQRDSFLIWQIWFMCILTMTRFILLEIWTGELTTYLILLNVLMISPNAPQ